MWRTHEHSIESNKKEFSIEWNVAVTAEHLFLFLRFLVAAAASILLHFCLELHFQCPLFASTERCFWPPHIECIFLFTIDWIFGAESESIEFLNTFCLLELFYQSALINSTWAKGCTRNCKFRLHVITSLMHRIIDPIVYPSDTLAIAPVSKPGLMPLYSLQN